MFSLTEGPFLGSSQSPGSNLFGSDLLASAVTNAQQLFEMRLTEVFSNAQHLGATVTTQSEAANSMLHFDLAHGAGSPGLTFDLGLGGSSSGQPSSSGSAVSVITPSKCED